MSPLPNLQTLLNSGAAIAACAAAGLWWYSAIVRVPYDENIPSGLNIDCVIYEKDGTDFLRTIQESTRFSKMAAFAAGVAAAFQAVAAFFA